MEEQKEISPDIGLKQWILKTITVAVTLLMFVYVVDTYFEISILADTILAIAIVLCIGFAHEGLHYYQAVKLGYKPKWYRTKIMMGFEISHHTNRKQWNKDKRKIALIPYTFLVPLSFILVVVGYQFDNLGMLIAGAGSILMHLISYSKEGIEVT